MRQHLAALGCVVIASGCSLIYNPDNIGSGHSDARPPIDAERIDAHVDAEIVTDVNADALAIAAITPSKIDEGVGQDMSRPVVVLITGMQITPGATVEFIEHDGSDTVTLGIGSAVVGGDADEIAIPLSVPVITGLHEGSNVAFDVKVSQPGANPITLPNALTVLGHDELDNITGSAGSAVALPASNTYSSVTYKGTITAADVTQPLVIHSFSVLSVMGAINISASGTTSGPGGGSGGGPGAPGIGAGGGASPGGGAGFTIKPSGANAGMEVGDAPLSVFTTPNRASGGGGGASVLGIGPSGGGGGGSLELVADGELQINTITANGGSGANGGTSVGGGGAGGVILLRAGVSIGSGGTPAVAAGAGGSAAAVGSPGRVRVDAPNAPAGLTLTTGASFYRGPMFDPATPLITTQVRPTVNLTGMPSTSYVLYFVDSQTRIHVISDTAILAGDGTDSEPFTIDLGHGANKVCAAVMGANATFTAPESSNCVQITYLLAPQTH